MGAAAKHEISFVVRKSVVFAGIAVGEVKQHEVEKADEAGGGETPAPAKIKEQQADEWNSDGAGEFCGGIGDRGGQTSFRAREPVSQRLGTRQWRSF